ncbi:MAG: FHA domain-containing protein [Polyangiaceae bacterium]|jgi:pSer/pThr/pTyr-binding forkhead associated (FHA) protein|nr:FHA domain-containing protein [Polyangiaceae bacterium]
MWKLTIEDDEQKQKSLQLDHTEYNVGRDVANEIRLTERNISRKHASLRQNGAGWVVRDLDSYNGTYVNGLRVAGEQHVSHGDVVQLGDYRLELVEEARILPQVPEQAAADPAVLPAHHRPDRLVVVVGPQPGQEFYLDREHFSMGRSEDADISVNHSSVSRFHAELFAVGNGRYEIIDKGSANGIRINGQEVRRGFIEAGDALELGDVRLRFVGAGKIFRAGFDRSQALPAITGFDAAIKSSSGGAKPAAASSSGILKMVAVGAALGVLGVGAAAAYVATRPPPNGATTSSADAPADEAGAKLLAEALELFDAGKLDEAHAKIAEIADGSPTLKDPAVQKIESAWAAKLFKEVEASGDDPQKQVNLLWQIRNNKNLDAATRRDADDKLRNFGVELPAELEDVKPNAPAPTFRPTAIAPRPPATTSALPPKQPGQPDRPALDDPDKKYNDLKARPIGSLTEGELKQLIGLCQSKGNNSCANSAAKRLKELKDNPAPAPSTKKP